MRSAALILAVALLLAGGWLLRGGGPAPAAVRPEVVDGGRGERGAELQAPGDDGARGDVAPEHGARPPAAAPTPSASPDPWAFSPHGRILRGDDPIPGVEVTATGRKDEIEHRAVTDERGAFAFEGLDGKQIVTLAFRVGAVDVTDPLRMVRSSDDRRERIYRLGSCSLEVRAHAADGGPNPGLRVRAQVRPTAGGERYLRFVETDSVGGGSFHELPPGLVEVLAAGPAPNSASLVLGDEMRSGVVVLGPAAELVPLAVELVLPDGTPALQRFQVHARGASSARAEPLRLDPRLGGGGVYELPVTPGTYRITLRPRIEGLGTIEVRATHGGVPTRIRLPGAAVRGMLRGREPRWPNRATGEPGLDVADSNYDARLEPSDGGQARSVRIADSNRFEFLGVPPGRYRLTARDGVTETEPVDVVVQSSAEVLDVELALEQR